MSGQTDVTRRRLIQLGGAGAVVFAADDRPLREVAAKLEYLTPIERAYILDKGKAGVAGMAPDRLREAGLVPETWRLEVTADPASDSTVEHPFTLDWKGLMTLAEKHVVRFMHVGVCTNGADPYHMCLWEGVPLREVVWPAGPKANVRRVYYESYHQENLAPFRGSLALSQILEIPPGQLPAILAFRMNGRPIPPSHGGPVRVIVPGGYGSKSIKWVQRMVLTNDYRGNDSDAADWNNDTESPLKTRARFINAPQESAAGRPLTLTGMAQVGISGLAKVQYAVHPQGEPSENWRDAAILPPPSDWGGGLPGGKLPAITSQTDRSGKPLEWPLPYTIVHWAAFLPGLPAGRYELCCRTIDRNGIAQPMPRPLPRTGVTAIHRVTLAVRG